MQEYKIVWNYECVPPKQNYRKLAIIYPANIIPPRILGPSERKPAWAQDPPIEYKPRVGYQVRSQFY